MALPTAQEAAQAWAQRLAGSTDRINRGVAGVTTAPGQAAARQKEVWAQNVAQSKDKWAQRVASVPLADWQQAMATKGVQRVASGATAAQPKMEAFMSQLLPHINSGLGALPARGGLDANINRMVSWTRHMAAFSRR
jgi:hypothetical protein